MGYSARYHAASLAAVFLALAVGILVGVGFGSDIVNGTADELENSLHSDLDQERDRNAELQDQLDREGQFGRLAYPALVDGRLGTSEIAIVALGDLDGELSGDVRSALTPAGATLQEIAVVSEPPDAGAAVDVVRGDSGQPLARGAAVAEAARRAGRLLVTGGRDFPELRSVLFNRFSGEPGDVDGVVLVRARPGDLSPREEQETDELEDALIEGIESTLIPVVGAERTNTNESSIGFFADHGAASVDDVDQLPGKVALVYTLDGAEGNYGVKETADGLLPDLLAPIGGR
jgi:hypothetical protein